MYTTGPINYGPPQNSCSWYGMVYHSTAPLITDWHDTAVRTVSHLFVFSRRYASLFTTACFRHHRQDFKEVRCIYVRTSSSLSSRIIHLVQVPRTALAAVSTISYFNFPS